MCKAKLFCYCYPMEKGCLVIGITTFLLSLAMVAISVATLVEKYTCTECQTKHLFLHTWPALNYVLSTVILLGVLLMGFSLLLILGILKNKASFVLSYFCISTVVTIVSQLGALLLLLDSFWIPSLLLFMLSCLNIYCLVVVHSVYDLMQIRRGLFERQGSDEEILVEQ